MLFRQFIDHTSCTYSYILADKESGDAIIIDPVKNHLNDYLQLIHETGLTLLSTLDTHTHADHITGGSALAQKTGCEIILGSGTRAQGATRIIEEGEEINFGRYCLTAIATPGHTNDSYCFYFSSINKRLLFTGDTLLIRGTGRTDFQQGSARQQFHSLFNKLLILPDDTIVYPGHDYKGWCCSSIGEEKSHNPRLQVSSSAEYISIMDNLNLPKPKLIDIAVPANLRCGLIEEG